MITGSCCSPQPAARSPRAKRPGDPKCPALRSPLRSLVRPVRHRLLIRSASSSDGALPRCTNHWWRRVLQKVGQRRVVRLRSAREACSVPATLSPALRLRRFAVRCAPWSRRFHQMRKSGAPGTRRCSSARVVQHWLSACGGRRSLICFPHAVAVDGYDGSDGLGLASSLQIRIDQAVHVLALYRGFFALSSPRSKMR